MKKLTREEFADHMRGFSERIERAQSEGNSNVANDVYVEQQRWIAQQQGNKPIVGALDPKSPHGSRGA